jgi:hypothetical protein
MLSNSVIAGALTAAYLTVLVLHLNPGFPLTIGAVLPLAIVMTMRYGAAAAAVFYALIVMRQTAASEMLSPGWLSVRVLSWLCTMAAGVVALIMWLNLSTYRTALDPDVAGHLTAAALTLSGSAVVFLLIAFAHLDRRGGSASAVLLIAMMTISIVALTTTRGWNAASRAVGRQMPPLVGPGSARPEARVVMIGLDGATLDVISPAVAEGRLPNFGRMLDGGAVLHLATLRPTQAETVWTAAATGRTPGGSGIRASALYRVRGGGPALELPPDYCFFQALVRAGLVRQDPHDARSLKARPLWNIVSDVGLPVGIVGFPLTHPAPAVSGFLISDEFHRLTDESLDRAGTDAIAPPTMLQEARLALREAASPDPLILVSAMEEAPQGDADARPDPAPILADRMHLQLRRALEAHTHPRLVAVRLPGLDAVAHYYLRYANPSAFGDVSDAERNRYGRVLNEYYAFIDTVIGHELEALGPDDLLMVVSGFGMEPLSPGKRILERLIGNARLSGTHERGPDGFLLAYGAAVAPGRPPRASVLDITPTLLYYFGLPVARDMDGFARTDLFRAAFTASRPITFIPSYGR